MNYILKSATPKGLPYSKKENPLDPLSPTIYGIDAIIITGIVGQTYNGFTNQNVGFCPLAETDTIQQAEAKVQAYGAIYVTTKYPNT